MDKEKLPKSPRALLLIDVINPLDFPGSENLATPALAAAKAIRGLKARLRKEGVPAIYANDNYGLWQSDFQAVFQRCVDQGGEAAEIAAMLAPKRGDLTILKPRHSAFLGTPLDLILDAMGAKTLIIAGFAADICVQITAMDGFLRGYRLRVPEDCTAAETEAWKAESLGYMKRVLRCDISSSDG